MPLTALYPTAIRTSLPRDGDQQAHGMVPLEAGRTLVTWQEGGTLYGRVLSEAGALDTKPLALGGPDVAIASAPGGGFAVMTLAANVPDTRASVQLYDASGQAIGAVATADLPGRTDAAESRLVALEGGGYLLLRTVVAQAGAEIAAQRLDAAFQPEGPAVALPQMDSADYRISDIAELAGGGFVIAYTETTEDDTATNSALTNAYLQRLDASGAFVGDRIEITGDFPFEVAGSGAYDPSVAAAPDGSFAAFWGSVYGPTYWQRFDAEGRAVTPKLEVGGYDSTPFDIAAAGPDSYALLWQQPIYESFDDYFPSGYATVLDWRDTAGAVLLSYEAGDLSADDSPLGRDLRPVALTARPGGGVIVAQTLGEAGGGQDAAVFRFGALPDSRLSGEDVTGTPASDLIRLTGDGARAEGGAGDDLLLGTTGEDRLDGGAGADVMVGGDGGDIYYLDHPGDVVVERLEHEGVDRAFGTVSMNLRGAAVERMKLTGSADAVIVANDLDNLVIGNAGRNTLYAAEGNDTLQGEAGNDTLYGNAGDDVLIGGAGADILNGGPGSDTYYVDNPGDRVAESYRWEGHDTVYSSVDFLMGRQHVEDLVLTGTADVRGIGNGLDNVIRGNGGANILDGGKGVDRLIGGAGNDTYLLRSPGDTVVEAAGGGEADTVKAFRSTLLPEHVERLYLQSVLTQAGEAVQINGIGNTLDNVIIGNPYDNVISGREGNDTLRGQAGADTFVFDSAPGAGNVDRILDFNTNTADEGDSLLFRSALFDGIGAGGLAPSQFVAGDRALEASDRFIFDAGSGRLWYDADGSGGGAQTLLMTFDQGAVVTAEDIFFV